VSELFLVPSRRKGENREAGEAVGFGIVGAGHIEEARMEIFDEHAPAEHARVGVIGGIGKTAMVGVDANVGTKEKGAKGAEGLNDGEKLFLMVVHVCCVDVSLRLL